MDYNKHIQRLEDLKNYAPGGWMPPHLLEQEQWAGCSPKDADYCGRLAEIYRFIEQYFASDSEKPAKVLCVRRDHGIAITVGGESSAILNDRAIKAVGLLRKTLDYLESKVDRRYMTPDELRRHERTRLRVQLEVEAQQNSRMKYNTIVQEQDQAEALVQQTQSVNL